MPSTQVLSSIHYITVHIKMNLEDIKVDNGFNCLGCISFIKAYMDY